MRFVTAKDRFWMFLSAVIVATAATQLCVPNVGAAAPLFYVQFGFGLAIFLIVFLGRPPSGPDAVALLAGDPS